MNLESNDDKWLSFALLVIKEAHIFTHGMYSEYIYSGPAL